MVKTGYMMNDLKQLLEKATNLKTAIDGLNGLDSDGSCTGELVSNLTSLQDLYKQLLIKNLEYALDKKIDHDLWNGIFKNRITAMQQRAKDKKNPRRTEAQNQLTAFLDSASGFYSSLLHELCQTFNVDIPGRVKANKLNLLRDNVTTESSCISQPERNSCQYMCQHCLVHLGDIARYRNQIGQAESYYHHAAQLLPSSGHPYNQLAILAAANGELLKMAFFYCRSIAVKGPFPGSDTNLRRQLSKIISGDDPKYQKISTSELLKFFLKLHACIYLKKKDNELPGMVERLSNFIRAHLRAGSLSHQQIIHMAFINLFSLQHLAPRGIRDGMPVEASCKRVTSPKNDSNDSTAIISTPNSDHPTTDDPANLTSQHKPWNAMLAFVLQNLGELLACIPVHSDELSELEHPALPAIKLLLDWLTTNSSVLKRKDIAQYSRVWPRLAKVLNALGNQDKANDMNGCPLPEDIEVRGFIGLFSSLQKLNFKASVDNLNNNSNSYASMTDKQHACRCYRLFQLGVVIVDHNSQLLHTKEENNSTVFSSSVLPSPQHAHNYNGLDDSTEHHNTSNYQRTQLNNNTSSSSTPHHDNGVVDGLDYESLSSPRRSNAVAVSSGEPGSRSTSLANFDAVAVINARETRNRNLLKNSTNSTEFAADGLLATSGGNGAGLRRNPRMQNVPVQMKPDHKLKVIKEEDMATSAGSSKFLQDNLADGSESGDASYAESLSQSDILSSASPCNVPPSSSNNNTTSNRTGNRVTFAANPTGFSPAPYLNEQSPSPSSLTDSFTAESSSAMAMYLSDVGSPQKQQQQQQHVMSQQAFRPIAQQPPINRAMYRPPSSFQPSPADATVFSSTNHHHNSDLFNPHHLGYGGFPPAQPNIQSSKQQNPPRFPLMPPPPFPSNSAVDPAAFLPPGAPPMFQSDGMPLQYPPHHMRIKTEHMSEQQQNNMLNQQQRMQASAGDFTNMFFPPAQKPNEMSQLKQPDRKNPISLYGLQSWNFPIATNIPPPVLPPASPSLADLSHAVRMNAALRRDMGQAAAAVDKNHRPLVTQQQQNMYKNAGGAVPIVNHSTSPYRTAEPGQFNHSMMLEQQQRRQGGKDNNAPSLSNGNMKGVSQGDLAMMEATGGANMATAAMEHNQLMEQSMAAAMRGMAAANTTAGSSSYSRRENVSGLHHQNDFAASVSEALMKNNQFIPEHSSVFPLGTTEESYQLFPDTDNSWGIGRGNNEGEGFGSSALGTIGSERAAAAQQQQYSPWSPQMAGGGLSGTPPNNNHHPSDAMLVAGGGGSLGKVPSAIIDSHHRNPNYSSQSFWSSPMTSSAPNALEQLIRRQQQTGGGATGGSGNNDPPP